MLPPILFFIFYLTITATAWGQLTPEKGALIYYEDRSVFNGIILQEDDDQIQLQIITKDTINLQKEFMDRFYRIPDDIQLFKKHKSQFNSGVFFSTSIAIGLNSFNGNSLLLDILVAKRVTHRASLGIGTGFYTNELNRNGLWFNTSNVPLFLYGRHYLTTGRRRLYTAVRLGYGLFTSTWDGDFQTGVLLHPEIGIHFAARKRRRFAISIGQYMQHMKGTYIQNFGFEFTDTLLTADINLLFNRTVLKLTAEFN